ncbi:MAG: peptidase MA family metallohydrolase [Candidatus Omnitrophota bacterium]|nr:peptidase MA family metallohydrolase [Candidatus Omnitrophota bacterium]
MRSPHPRAGLSLFLAFTLLSVPVLAAEQQASAYSRAVAAYNERDLDAALRYAKEAVSERPGHADTHILLGQLYYLRQDLKRAKESWERALKLAPDRKDVKEALEKLGREAGIEKTMVHGDTHPFVLRFAEGQVPVESSFLREILRDAYRKIGQQFNYFPDHAIPVLLYSDSDFQKIKSLSHSVGGLYDGKIRLPLKPGSLNGDRLQAILWHEYTHAVVHDLSRGRCPMWLNEGIATSQEFRIKNVEVGRVRAALEQEKLPAWDLLWSESRYDQATLDLYYQTSFMITQYLVRRWSWKEMARLLERLGQGTPMRDALRAQYRTDPAVIEKEWRAWLRKNL